MRINDIRMPDGANRPKKRRGRGDGSGHGKTSCRGNKGLLSRTGGHGGPRLGFEGGQMPLARRIPKRGFTSKFKKIFQVVNVESMNRFENNSVVSQKELFEANLISSEAAKVKILGNGDLKKSLTVKAHSFSKSAIEKIKNSGGNIEPIQAPKV